MIQAVPALGGGELVLLLSRGVGLLLELREAGGAVVDVVTVDGICSFASCSSANEGQWSVVVGRENGRVKLLRIGLGVEPEVQSRGEWNLWDLQHNNNGQLRYINVQEEDMFAFAPLIKSGQHQQQSVTFVHFDEKHGFAIAATGHDRCVSLSLGAGGAWTHVDIDLTSCGAAPHLDPSCAAVLDPSDPQDALQACAIVSITREVSAAKGGEPVVFLGCRCGALLWFACSWLKRGKVGAERAQTTARVAAFYPSPLLGLGLACLFPTSHSAYACVSHLLVVEADAVSGVGVAPLQGSVIGDSFRHTGVFGSSPPAWLPPLPGLRRGSFLYCEQGGVWAASFAAQPSTSSSASASAAAAAAAASASASASSVVAFVAGTLLTSAALSTAVEVAAAVRKGSGDELHSVSVFQASGIVASVPVPPDFPSSSPSSSSSSSSSSETAALAALQELFGGRPSVRVRGGEPALPSALPPSGPAPRQLSSLGSLGSVLSDVAAANVRLRDLEAQARAVDSELLQLASLATLLGRDRPALSLPFSPSSSSSSWLGAGAGAGEGGVLRGGPMGMGAARGWRSGLRIDFECRAGGLVLAKHSTNHGAAGAAAAGAGAGGGRGGGGEEAGVQSLPKTLLPSQLSSAAPVFVQVVLSTADLTIVRALHGRVLTTTFVPLAPPALPEQDSFAVCSSLLAFVDKPGDQQRQSETVYQAAVELGPLGQGGLGGRLCAYALELEVHVPFTAPALDPLLSLPALASHPFSSSSSSSTQAQAQAQAPACGVTVPLCRYHLPIEVVCFAAAPRLNPAPASHSSWTGSGSGTETGLEDDGQEQGIPLECSLVVPVVSTQTQIQHQHQGLGLGQKQGQRQTQGAASQGGRRAIASSLVPSLHAASRQLRLRSTGFSPDSSVLQAAFLRGRGPSAANGSAREGSDLGAGVAPASFSFRKTQVPAASASASAGAGAGAGAGTGAGEKVMMDCFQVRAGAGNGIASAADAAIVALLHAYFSEGCLSDLSQSLSLAGGCGSEGQPQASRFSEGDVYSLPLPLQGVMAEAARLVDDFLEGFDESGSGSSMDVDEGEGEGDEEGEEERKRIETSRAQLLRLVSLWARARAVV